jgi:predicted Zn-dependent peptidase
MIKSNTERFIGEFNDNKFERKNCISKICGMSKYRNLLCLLLLLLSFAHITCAQPETTKSGDLFSIKLVDGLNTILMPLSQAVNTEITFSIKTGSMYETDSISGMSNLVVKIFNQKIINALKSGKGLLTTQNVTFEGYATTEHAIFKFTTSAQNLTPCLSLFRDSVFNGKIYQSEINPVRNIILQQFEDARHDKKKIFEERLLQGLYVQDHQKLEVAGNGKEIKDFDRGSISRFFKRYYVPNNTFMTITGPIDGVTVENTLESLFKTVMRSEFDPETVTKIVDLRPMAYNTQFIVNDTSATPEFQICWQFPGTDNNFQDSYAAFLLNAILNDKNNFIQAKVAKMGCKKFTVQYDANNFNGIFRITLQPSKKNMFETYQFVINELGRLNKTLVNDVMITAAKIQFKKEYESLKKSKEYPQWIVKYTTFNDENYFPALLDSVMAVTPKQLETFVIDYFNQSPHIAGLRISQADREGLKVDSFFTDLDQSVARYVFTYRQNVTTLEGADNELKLRNLLQWVTINPDINIQVNGFSDEHEYNRTTDEDSIVAFIDSMPSFSRVTSEIIKKKRTIRPELARAAKIVRYLYDHGISAERLDGTAMMYKSENKQDAADNMKCTLTLNKLRKSPSLYEYHYGKKKE